ncbi:MAG: thioether cross-link-forming SCIFF peptide maturase, partial [Clostridia bacterium]|nr:thioether cross-link-forming SCIFF peptide maturase [Clostridia bacterium]
MIHQYKLGGYNIVLDVPSGSLHVVDEVAYDIIGLFEKESKENILSAMKEKYADREDITPSDVEECYAQVESLRDMGKLFV